MHLAAQFGHVEATTWLLKHRADAEAFDLQGHQTALHVAVSARPLAAVPSGLWLRSGHGIVGRCAGPKWRKKKIHRRRK